MIKTKHINELKIGQNIYGFYHTIFKEKISKNGDKYIDVELRDRTGKINAKIWQFIEFYDKAFNEGDVVAVKGEIKRFREIYSLKYGVYQNWYQNYIKNMALSLMIFILK